MSLQFLFPIPMGVYELPDFDTIKQKFVPTLIDEYKQADNKNRKEDNWNCNSYQTFLYGRGQEELTDTLYSFIDDYLINIGIPRLNYKLQSWFNVYGAQQYQEIHSHEGALMSGMLVLNFNKDQHTKTLFRNPYREYAREFEKHNCASYNLSISTDRYPLDMEEGKFYIWPSTLEHNVPPQPNNLTDLRVTYTINLVPIKN